jgi:hypothetical protein
MFFENGWTNSKMLIMKPMIWKVSC